MDTVTLTAGEHPYTLLLISSLEIEATAVGTAIHLGRTCQHHKLRAPCNLFVGRMVWVEGIAHLIHM